MMAEHVKNVPSLRFPEFDGEWSKARLENQTNSIVSGKTKPQPDGEYNVFGSTGIIGKSDICTHDGKYILVARVGANAGTLNMVSGVFSVTDNTLIVDANDNTDVNFLYYKLKQFHLNRMVFGSGQPLITGGQLKSLILYFPIIPEQQKIADFLTAVDKRITQLEEKKRLLTEYKKGVMRQIFSQQIRFTDDNGNPYPDWEEKRLGDVASKKSSSLAANELESNEGEYSVFGASGYIKSIDFYDEKEAYIAIVKDGAGVGRLLLCEAFTSVLGTLDKIKPSGLAHIGFLVAYMSRIHFPKYVIGSTIPHIYFKDYAREKLQLPCLEEQQKIADFLASIDNKVEQVGAQLEQAKTFKKGLLQQMFV